MSEAENKTAKKPVEIEEDHIQPAFITDNETGIKYELDFSRESVAFMERKGFDMEQAIDKPVTGFPELFYYAFRKNHRSVPRERVDKLYDKMGGLTEGLLKRLVELYNQAALSNTIKLDEEMEQNPLVTLEL